MWFEAGCPWKEHLYEIEKENGAEGQVKFIFRKDQRGLYRIQAVSESISSFTNRVSLCAAYRGKRNAELNAASGFEDCEFVHAAGFVGGAWSLETAIKMAEASIQEHNQPDPSQDSDMQKQ